VHTGIADSKITLYVTLSASQVGASDLLNLPPYVKSQWQVFFNEEESEYLRTPLLTGKA